MPELNRTLTIGSTGEDVGDIQFRLRVLKQDIPDEEINGSYYGPETQKAVRAFQAGAGLTPDRPGEVDRVTAERIDELFAKVSDEVKATFLQFELTPTDIGTLAAMLGGSLEAQATTLAGIDANLDAQLTKVEAQTNVLTELANTLSDPPPLAINASGPEVKDLIDNLTNDLKFFIPDYEKTNQVFGVGTRDALLQFQADKDLLQTGVVDEATRAALKIAVDAAGPNAIKPRVEGRVMLDNGKPVSKAAVRLFSGFGTERTELTLGPVEIDSQGFYTIEYNLKGAPANLSVDLEMEGMRLQSLVKFGATAYKEVNFVLPGQNEPPISSFTRLTQALKDSRWGITDLTAVPETEQGAAITFLAEKTGWDAQDIIYFTKSEQLSAETMYLGDEPEIPPEYFYALLRAGLPADATAIYNTPLETVNSVWESAISQEDIPGHKPPDKVLSLFQKIATTRALDNPPSVGVSSFREIIALSFGKSTTEKYDARRFLSLYAQNLDDPANFWTAVEKEFDNQQAAILRLADLYTQYRGDINQFWNEVYKTFGKSTERRLRLDGQLAYLTINNAPLVDALHKEVEKSLANKTWAEFPTPTLKLAELGYYDPSKWQHLLENNPGIDIPKEIPGATLEDRRNAYANLQAAQVRRSFPTAVVAQQINVQQVPLQNVARKDDVSRFLMQHQAEFNFEVQPVEQYLRNLPGFELTPEIEAVAKEITCIQRVHQITPNDTALIALLKKQLYSAYDVARIDQSEFVKSVKHEVGGETTARMIYAKAQEVHNTALNVAVSYLTARVAPGIGVSSPARYIDPMPATSNAGGVIDYPTLEGLFGELDFCACEHCRSWLSPAAYLVDLLQFLDNNDAAESPLAELLSRRPDIQYIPLTCENTNIPVPYIDLVNEVLEYYLVHHRALQEFEGYDTDGTITSEELLANPQNVNEGAYQILYQTDADGQNALPPTHLFPFHRSLEALRRYFDKFDAPLPNIMEALLTGEEDLERSGSKSEPAYGWRDILMEELRLNRKEYDLLTASFKPNSDDPNSDPDLLKTLKYLCGSTAATSDELLNGSVRSSNAPDLPGIANAKAFTRLVGITYEELDEILKTRFVNPASTLIPKLERLHVPFATLARFKAGELDEEAFGEALKTPIDARHFGSDKVDDIAKIKEWVKSEANYKAYMSLITLTTPLMEWTKGRGYQIGDCVRPVADVETGFFECVTSGTSGATPPTWPAASGSTVNDGEVVWKRRSGLNDCSFGTLRFRYADPAKENEDIRLIDYIRLLRFIRLWKKLGWSIAQTDKAITALYPSDQVPDLIDDPANLQNLDKGFLILLPRLGVIKRVMDRLKLNPDKDLLPLLACFAPLDTHGDRSLYRKLFLNAALLNLDPAFRDNGYGDFFVDSSEKLIDHQEALRAAFGLTAEEFSLIVDSPGFLSRTVEVPYTQRAKTLKQAILTFAPGISYQPDVLQLSYTGILTVETRDALKSVTGVSYEFKSAVDALYAAYQDAISLLSVENISAVFRRGWLARKLKVSVREFLLLTSSTAINPFDLPLPTPAFSAPILRLIELVERLQTVSLKPADALYLIWNQDVTGKSAPEKSEITAFASSLRAALAAVESEFVIQDDPDGQIARARMALVYGDQVADQFFGIINNTVTTDVEYSRNQDDPLITRVPYERRVDLNPSVSVPYDNGNPTLDPEIVTAAVGKIIYDSAGKQLVAAETFDEALKNAVKAAAKKAFQGDAEKIDAFGKKIEELYISSRRVDETKLEQAIVSAAPDSIAYEEDRKALRFTGVMTSTACNALKSAAASAWPNNSDAIEEFNQAVDRLLGENQNVIKANLDQAIVDVAPGRIAYDPFRKRLAYAGVMSATVKDRLTAAAESMSSESDQEQFKIAVGKLHASSQRTFGSFLATYPELDAYLFFGELQSTAAYRQENIILDKAILNFAGESIAYDHIHGRLSFKGVLTEQMRNDLLGVTGGTPDFRSEVTNLFDANSGAVNSFFNTHRTLQGQRIDYITASNGSEQRWSLLMDRTLLKLKDRRKRQQALQMISAVAQTDVAFATTILDRIDDKTVLAADQSKPEQPALDDLVSMEKPGLSVRFSMDTGEVDEATRKNRIRTESRNAEAILAYAKDSENELPDKLRSGVWYGYLEAPEDGFYNFQVETDKPANVTLRIGERSVLAKTADAGGDSNLFATWSNVNPIELRVGTLYFFRLEVKRDTHATAIEKLAVRWQTTGRGWEIIPARYLYSDTLIDHLHHSYGRFFKVAALATALKLTANELAHLSAKYEIASKGWLNYLQVTRSQNPATSIALLNAFRACLNYARIKANLSPGDERLLDVLRNPTAKSENGDSLLLALTRWERGSLDALLARFDKTDWSALQDFDLFRRVYDAYVLLKRLGIPASALINAATNEPKPETVRELQSALRARYDANDWLALLKPINDELRAIQRDALVAYILHQNRTDPKAAHINTPDKLFEQFLMDVQMEPCMETSRIRHALSSIQLFVDRCLMNLEPHVSPAAISANQWEWRNRYRVWEANRKVFLQPENWLEPELRDNQSPFFKETMSELLQGDITEDRAATALVSYLFKLEEVAKLEICGMHYVEADPATQTEEVVHVVGRTAGANRKYYYRRRDSSGWTPWEQIKLEIEDNPVILVVWKGRLFLFWLKILKQGQMDPTKLTTSSGPVNEFGQELELSKVTLSQISTKAGNDAAKNTTVTVQAVLCWSEYYNGKWQPAKTSDMNKPAMIGSYDIAGEQSFSRSRLEMASDVVKSQYDDSLKIYVGDQTFVLYNTYSLPSVFPFVPYSMSTGKYGFTTPDVGKRSKLYGPLPVLRAIIGKPWTVVEPSNITVASDASSDWISASQADFFVFHEGTAPFFFEDSRHVFYVTPTAQIVLIPEWHDIKIPDLRVIGESTYELPIDRRRVNNG